MFRRVNALWRNVPRWSERGADRGLSDFLPPSLEVLEKPPHPAPRVLLWVTVAIFVAGLAWATVGRVDIITGAEGRIIPGGKTRVIQPLERGVVSVILVREGQMVKAGEPLVELDQAQVEAERLRVESDLDFVVRRLVRREILADWLSRADGFGATRAEVDAFVRGDGRDIDAGLLYEEWRALAADAETLASQLEERRAEHRASRIVIAQYEATLPLLRERVDAYSSLYKQRVVGRMEYLTLEEERQRQEHAHAAEVARSEQLAAAITSTERQMAAQRAKGLSDVLGQADDLRRQRKSLEQEVAKLRDTGAKMVLSSPVDGTVKGLNVHTVGGVVDGVEVLMEIVPLHERLEVEAFVGNEDIGYVREGQTAEVKIHTFPFTRYGVIRATVESVARDATVDEKLGLVYRARLGLEENVMLVDGKLVQLIPGMAVTAEIATGERRLIEFFLAPLLRAKRESLRER